MWLPSPYWTRKTDLGGFNRIIMRIDALTNRPGGHRVFEEAFGQISINSPWLYLTDGGHYDNLGLLEALNHKPTHIILLDGSGDAEDQFPTIGRAIATARMDSGTRIEFDPAPMMRGSKTAPHSGSSAWCTPTSTTPATTHALSITSNA